MHSQKCVASLSLKDLADISNQFYEGLQQQGVPNEDARFGLLEASNSKILIAMNAHALLDFFSDRVCSCAQWEIRHMAREMMRLAKEDNPQLFAKAGPKCDRSGFCHEQEAKWEQCKRNPHVSQRLNIPLNELVMILENNELADAAISSIIDDVTASR